MVTIEPPAEEAEEPTMAHDQAYWDKWYAENREALNRRRRERYKKDPKYRKEVLARTKEYKETHPTPPRGSVRVVGGEEIKVVRIGALAEKVSRSILSIRNWHRDGLLPDPNVGEGTHRVYTVSQVHLVMQLAAFLDEHRYQMRDPQVKAKLKVLVKAIKRHW